MLEFFASIFTISKTNTHCSNLLHGLHSSLWWCMGCVGLCLLDKLVFAPFLHFSFPGCVHQCSCLGLMSNPSHVLCALLLVLIIVTILTVVLILVVLFLPFFSYQRSSPLSSLFHLVLILVVFFSPFFLVGTHCHCHSHHHPHHGLVLLALFFLLVLITMVIGINDFIFKKLIH